MAAPTATTGETLAVSVGPTTSAGSDGPAGPDGARLNAGPDGIASDALGWADDWPGDGLFVAGGLWVGAVVLVGGGAWVGVEPPLEPPEAGDTWMEAAPELLPSRPQSGTSLTDAEAWKDTWIS